MNIKLNALQAWWNSHYDIQNWYENRKCPHCNGAAHSSYREGFDCCKTQFEIANRAWKIADSIKHTREVVEANLPTVE